MPTLNPPRILVTDDQHLFRDGLIRLIRHWNAEAVIEEATNGADAIACLARSPFDLLILDYQMPGMSGIATLQEIRNSGNEIPVLVLSQFESEAMVKSFVRLGISGLLNKSIRYEVLVKALNALIRGGEYFPSDLSKWLVKTQWGRDELLDENQAIELSEREEEILKAVCAQLSAEETAEQLGLSLSSVKKYRSSLLDKTGSKNTLGLMVFALRSGRIQLDEL
jgi:DNA-binding NarL/FixJ family response regulator